MLNLWYPLAPQKRENETVGELNVVLTMKDEASPVLAKLRRDLEELLEIAGRLQAMGLLPNGLLTEEDSPF